jgi:hypothetical protein
MRGGAGVAREPDRSVALAVLEVARLPQVRAPLNGIAIAYYAVQGTIAAIPEAAAARPCLQWRLSMIVMVQHRVRDYGAWKPVFDEHGEVRRRYGATGHVIYRSLDDPNDVTVVNFFPSRQQAEALVADPSTQEGMERAGVIGEPRVTWAGETERVDY